MTAAESAAARARPQLAASACIFRNGRILLLRRAREPGAGRWSVPGGRVEHGETLEQAIRREVMEEAALAIDVVGFAGIREVLPRDGVSGHYVVLSFAARWAGGEATLNDEHDDVRWADPVTLDGLVTTEGLAPIVAAARSLVGP